jgi:hypothetical protein
MYENRAEPLLPRKRFALRLARSIAFGLCLITLGLVVGSIGYHVLEGMPWVDAFLNSSMILTCMGPVNPVQTTAGKLFAASYALFSGIAFPTTIGIIVAPLVHRFLHRLHAEEHRRHGQSQKHNHNQHPPVQQQ